MYFYRKLFFPIMSSSSMAMNIVQSLRMCLKCIFQSVNVPAALMVILTIFVYYTLFQSFLAIWKNCRYHHCSRWDIHIMKTSKRICILMISICLKCCYVCTQDFSFSWAKPTKLKNLVYIHTLVQKQVEQLAPLHSDRIVQCMGLQRNLLQVSTQSLWSAKLPIIFQKMLISCYSACSTILVTIVTIFKKIF